MVNSGSQNNPLWAARDCRYCRRSGLSDSREQAETGAHPTGTLKGSGTIMKKVAIVTVAVVALGLAACAKNNADNNAANETAVENNAETDVNAATNAGAEANADAALNAAGNEVANAGAAVNNASNAVENK
jgi:hypothetical protein